MTANLDNSAARPYYAGYGEILHTEGPEVPCGTPEK